LNLVSLHVNFFRTVVFFVFLPLFSPFPFPFVLPFFSEGGNGEAERDWCSDLFLFHVVQRFIPEIEGEQRGENRPFTSHYK